MKKLVICGDSYSVGIGCHDLHNEPYGSLLSKHLNLDLVNLAKGSSTNLSIFLQVKYAIENIQNIDFLIIGVTSFNRIQWLPEGFELNREIKNSDVNYHEYPPYGEGTYPMILDNPMKDDVNYNGKMLTENFYGILSYVDEIIEKKIPTFPYYNKFKNEKEYRLKLLKEFYYEFFDDRIQKQFDIGVITMSHILLKNMNIKHLILCNIHDFKDYVDKKYLMDVNWLELSQKYPDDLKSLHTSKEGHNEVYNKIINHIL